MIITNLEDIKKYQGVIAPELYGHPQFMRELDYAIKWYKEECGPVALELKVSNDGKKIKLSHQFFFKRGNPLLDKNNKLLAFQFEVDKNGGLIVDTSSGVCYDKEQYVDAVSKDFVNGELLNNPEKKMKVDNLYRDYTSILKTYYHNTYYNAEGIQMRKTYFSDLYPLTYHRYSDDLTEQVLSSLHRPKEWSHNLGPTMPEFFSNAHFTHYYRYPEDLGIVHKMVHSGIHPSGGGSWYKIDEVNHCWELLHGEYPEFIMSHSGLSIAEPKKGVAKQFEYVGLGDFSGLTVHEIHAKVADLFLKMVDNSKTRELNPVMYEKLRNNAIATVKKYNPEFVDANLYQR